MPLFTWDPVPSFVARQVNILADVGTWVDEVTDAGLLGPKDGLEFRNMIASAVDGDPTSFRFEYDMITEVDGTSHVNQVVEFGHWVIANSLYAINQPWFESDESFGIRFQPFNGLLPE